MAISLVPVLEITSGQTSRASLRLGDKTYQQVPMEKARIALGLNFLYRFNYLKHLYHSPTLKFKLSSPEHPCFQGPVLKAILVYKRIEGKTITVNFRPPLNQIAQKAQRLVDTKLMKALPDKFELVAEEIDLSSYTPFYIPGYSKLPEAIQAVQGQQLTGIEAEVLLKNLAGSFKYTRDGFVRVNAIANLASSIGRKEYGLPLITRSFNGLNQFVRRSDFYQGWQRIWPETQLPPEVEALVAATEDFRDQDFSTLSGIQQNTLVLLNRVLIQLKHEIMGAPFISLTRIAQYNSWLRRPRKPLSAIIEATQRKQGLVSFVPAEIIAAIQSELVAA